MDPPFYPARSSFGGRSTFVKHVYPLPGELDDDVRAEESASRNRDRRMPEVRFRVRNLERHPVSSFRRPTSTDRFHPDLVLQLNDERIVVVEYEGADRWSIDDSKERREIGKGWAATTAGRCRFVMVMAPSAAAGRSVAVQIREAMA